MKLLNMNYYDEITKCKNDFIYFVEHYCTVNSKPIKLSPLYKNKLEKYVSYCK